MNRWVSRKLNLSLVALLVLVGLAGRGPTLTQFGSARNLMEDENRVLTLSKYETIRPGMTYEELIEVLNVPPQYQPDDIGQVGWRSDVTLTWFTGSEPVKGPTLKVILKGMVVTDKWQAGLK